jgi:hypothetical protein
MVPKNCIMRSFITCNIHSPSIIKIIKSKRMRKAAHIAGTGEKRNAYRISSPKWSVLTLLFPTRL